MARSLEVEALRERLRWDTCFWAEHCATILTEDKQTVALRARPWQRDFDAALERQRAEGRPMRALILKARKLGFSTWVQAKLMQRVTQLPFQYALVVAQDRKTAGILMDMGRLMYDRLPTEEMLGLGFSIRPQIVGEGQTRAGARFMSLGSRQRPTEASIYETISAGSGAAGRGYTPSMVHASEVAHWEDPDFLIGLLNAVPKRPETIVVLESTANGFNHFYERWQRAVQGEEDELSGGLYAPLFYGWQDNPFNALPFVNDQARDRFVSTIGDPDGGGDDEEPWLVEEFGVTLEQLRWRRVTMADDCDGHIEVFHQEHPATPEQAFIGSGFPVFPGVLVSRAIKAAEAAAEPVEGLLRGGEWKERRTRAGTVRVPQTVLWVPRSEIGPADRDVWGSTSRLVVWEHPLNEVTQEGLARADRKPNGQYVIFADIGYGEGNTTGDGDYHAAQVLDHVTREQVARWRSRIPLHDVPLALFLLGLYFNTAWLAPEVNGPGVGVVDVLAKDMHYPRLYRRGRRGDDDRADRAGHLLGWQTDLRTKPLMEQTFGAALKDGTHGLRCVLTGREFTTYVEDPKNRAKHGAQKGAHDDLAMAFMGAHRVAAELRPRDPNAKPRRSVRGRTVEDPLTGW